MSIAQGLTPPIPTPPQFPPSEAQGLLCLLLTPVQGKSSSEGAGGCNAGCLVSAWYSYCWHQHPCEPPGSGMALSWGWAQLLALGPPLMDGSFAHLEQGTVRVCAH